MPLPRARANAARFRKWAGNEHVFAEQKASMGLFIRTIGLARAKANIRLVNLAYNLKRFAMWQRSPAAA